MIEKPPSPHGLIGDHWPEIDELGIATVATALAKAGTGAGTAEQKSYQDGTTYQTLLPEGFETQVDAAFKVGGMAADLSGWFTKCATETGVVAEGVALGKLLIAVTTMVAEAVIASKEAEIIILSLFPSEASTQRIQQLRAEIKQITDDAKQAIQELYDGIYTPTAPASPGLQPLIHSDQPFPQFQYGTIVPAGSGTGSETGKGDTSALDNPIPGTKGDVSQGVTETGNTQSAQNPSGALGDTSPSTGVPGNSPPVAATPSVPSTSTPSSSGLSSVGSAMPKMPSTPSAPSGGGLGGGSGLSGLSSGGGASASPASLNPTQQFLNGAAQGFSQSPVATGASAATAAAQPFRPPAGSTMQTSPAPLAPTAPAAATPSAPAGPQQVVTSSPSAPVAAGTPPISAGAGGVPLAPPPTAGVPNAAPPPSPVAPPPAAAAPPGGGGGGGPVSGPPPGIMNLGGKNAALKAMQMGAHTVGEGLRSTPEFSAAMSLVSALNDPERPAGSLILGGWSCAVFGAGASMRFVVAERHGLSWIPAGVYLPAGVTVAHLDERVPADVRHSWRGLDPSALVLAEYAKAIGEQPRIVVARAYHPGMPGWFGRDVVLAADEASRVIIPNPLHEPGGRHRLELAAPEHWRWVMSLPDEVLAEEVQAVAQWLVGEHDQMFAQWPDAAADAKLRALALSQIGREGGAGDVKQLLAAKMGELATRLIGAPNYGTPQWGVHTGMEMALRGWEALLLSLGSPSRTVMADIQYAVLMATQPILPPPIVVAAGA